MVKSSGEFSRDLILLGAEIDILISKLLGFETFYSFWRVLVSVLENLVLGGKKCRFRKIWSRKKCLSFGFRKFGPGKKVSVLVSQNLVSEKSCGFGKIGLKKKVSILDLENLVSEKKKSK